MSSLIFKGVPAVRSLGMTREENSELACRLLRIALRLEIFGGVLLQYTIEARELTNEYTHRPAHDVASRRLTVEAGDADEAITQYLRECMGELVSCSRPARGQESIATVKQEDTVYLVRVYAA